MYNNISGDAVTIQHRGGLVGIGINAPQEKLHVHNGNIRTSHNVYAGGQVRATSFQYTSDIRKKTNIAPLQNSLQKLLALRGYSYMWKDSGEYDIGLIAQEVETVFPELIGEGKDEDGTTFKTVKYGNLVAPMIDAIGELNTKIEQQDKRIKEQEKQIEMLIERLEAQEQLIQSLQ